jgi:hypothetical protein
VGYNAGMNWYAYCGNSPVNWIDAYGYEPIAAAQPTMPATGVVYDANNKKWWWLSGEWSQAQISAAWNADPAGMYVSVVDGYSVWVVSTKNQTASGDTVEITGEAGIMDSKAATTWQARIRVATEDYLTREFYYKNGYYGTMPVQPIGEDPRWTDVPRGFPWDKQPEKWGDIGVRTAKDAVTSNIFDAIRRALGLAVKVPKPLGLPMPGVGDETPMGAADTFTGAMNRKRDQLLKDFAWAHWWADWFPDNGWPKPTPDAHRRPDP